MLPLANVFASANQNEKRHSLIMVKKTWRILSESKAKIRSVIADSQYSDQKLREAVVQRLFRILQIRNRELRAYCGWIRSLELMDLMSSGKNIISDLLLRQFTAF